MVIVGEAMVGGDQDQVCMGSVRRAWGAWRADVCIWKVRVKPELFRDLHGMGTDAIASINIVVDIIPDSWGCAGWLCKWPQMGCKQHQQSGHRWNRLYCKVLEVDLGVDCVGPHIGLGLKCQSICWRLPTELHHCGCMGQIGNELM